MNADSMPARKRHRYKTQSPGVIMTAYGNTSSSNATPLATANG